MNVDSLLAAAVEANVQLWTEKGQLRFRAPEEGLPPELRELLLGGKEPLAAWLEENGVVAPTSFAQQGLWFLETFGSARAAYASPLAVTIDGPLDAEAFEAALADVAAHHESLRTRFLDLGGRPAQCIAPAVHLPLERRNLAASASPEGAFAAACEGVLAPSFDLSQAPLARCLLARLGADRWGFLLAMHHIVTDGSSMAALMRDLLKAYGSRRRRQMPSFDVPGTTFRDFAQFQRREWAAGRWCEHRAYWRNALAHAPAVIDLPTDRPRPPVRSFAGAWHEFRISSDLTQELQAWSRARQTTLFTTLLTAFHTLLARYSRQGDIVVGTPIAGRHLADIENVAGFFAAVLPLRLRLDPAQSAETLAAANRRAVQDAFAHQELPFERMVEDLEVPRDPAYTPIFQVMFVLQNMTLPPPEQEGLRFAWTPLPRSTAKFDLSLSLLQHADGLDGSIEYSTALFDAETIEGMGRHFVNLLDALAAEPSSPVGSLDFLTSMERKLATEVWASPTADYTNRDYAARRVMDWAVQHPDAPAVQDPHETLTYGKLAERAQAVAAALRVTGIGAESIVALYLDRSAALCAAELGVWLAGAAFLPLDPAAPEARIRFMLEDAAPGAVLTTRGMAQDLPQGIDAPLVMLEDCRHGSPREYDFAPADLAYVIYTSGSTGKPKGVLLEQGGLRNLIAWSTEHLRLQPGDRAAQFSSPVFDASIYEIWSALAAGATLVFVPDERRPSIGLLCEWFADEGITMASLSTALVEQAFDFDWPEDMPLHCINTGGDALRRHPPAGFPFRLVNNYGPTENTVGATAEDVPPLGEAAGPPSIGKPVPNTEVYILDEALRPVPPGVPGEIFLGGAQVARGYLNRPELTAERFVPHPFAQDGAARVYRTGDLARWLTGGRIQFLGRLDHQVKLRGYRVELGEIEAALAAHDAVEEAAVLCREDEPGTRYLAAYFTHRGQPPDRASLRTYLGSLLPGYMVPTHFVALDALPRTVSSKPDRNALPKPDSAALSRSAIHRQPETPAEKTLAAIWADVLGVEMPGAEENFFALGGDSIRSIQVVTRAREAGLALAPQDIFECQTVAALAAQADAHEEFPAHAGALLAAAPVPPAAMEAAASRWKHGAIEETYRLTPLQAGMLFHTLASPGSGEYVDQFEARIEGKLDARTFAKAWGAAIGRHAVLRTAFLWEGLSEPVQVVLKEVQPPWRIENWAGLDPAEVKSRWAELAEAERQAGSALDCPPLMRFALIQTKDDAWRFLWTSHHILTDGWSVPLILADVLKAYEQILEDGEGVLAPAPPFSRYIAWLEQQNPAEAVDDWRQTLDGALLPARLPWKKRQARNRHEEVEAALPAALERQLLESAKRFQISLGALLHASWGLLLAWHGGRDDVVFGTTLGNRPSELPGVEAMAGPLLNTLPFRVHIGPSDTAAAFLGRVHAALVNALRCSHAPLRQVQQALGIAGGQPLFEALLAVENFPIDQALTERSPGFRVAGFRAHMRTNLPLSAVVRTPGLHLRLSYQSVHCTPQCAAQLLDQWQTLLGTIASARGDSPVGQLTATLEGERSGVRPLHPEAPPSPQAWEPPQTGIEEQLAALWREMLGAEYPGRRDNFFGLGGHSLMAIQLLSKVKERFGVETPIQAMLADPTIAGLAERIAQGQDAGSTFEGGAFDGHPIVVPFLTHGAGAMLFFVAPAGGVVMTYYALAAQIGQHRPFIALQDPRMKGPDSSIACIEDLAARYAAALQEVQPHGPYRIAGWSFGGVVAFETARQLEAKGEAVDFLGVVDAEIEESAQRHGGGLTQRMRNLGRFLALAVQDGRDAFSHVRDGFYMMARLVREKRHDPANRHRWRDFLRWLFYDAFYRMMLRRAHVEQLMQQDQRLKMTEVPGLVRCFATLGANLREGRAYRPAGRVRAKVTLFQTQMTLEGSRWAGDPTQGWGRLSAQGADVVSIPGNHAAVFSPPYVDTLAKKLEACLDELDGTDARRIS